MNFVEKLNSLIDPSLKNKFRYYEKLQNKIISQEYSIVFNEKCIKESLFPNYICTAGYTERVHVRTELFYKN